MCTVTTYTSRNHYFGRNLDLEFSYHEEVTIAPRKFPFLFRHAPYRPDPSGKPAGHHAIIGMAFVQDNYPLYYDATNEMRLSIAGLNFPSNASYSSRESHLQDNITSFEFIPWILTQCDNLKQARILINRICILDESFSDKLPPQPLHWMVSDQTGSIVVEALSDGIHVYDNPTGTMTNNPTFDHQLFRLNDYRNLTPYPRQSTFAKPSNPSEENNKALKLQLDEYSRGMGAIGLPGDLSSGSRFVRAVFTRMNSISDESEESSVNQFFHILSSVEQQRGCCRLQGEKNEITIYSSCCNIDQGIYYYRTYDNSQITAIHMHHENLNTSDLIRFPLIRESQIHQGN